MKADAIVNTANPEPEIGSGTDSAVYAAAGREKMLAARRKIGRIACGEAAWTPGYALPVRYVIHAVSPVWQGGAQGEEALLRKTYDAALAVALKLRCSSVAFPLLSAGNYGFPKDAALGTAIRAFTDFLMEHEMEIELVLFDSGAFGLAGSLFDDLKSYIDDNYIEQKKREEYGTSLEEERRREMLRRRREASAAQLETIEYDGLEAAKNGFVGGIPGGYGQAAPSMAMPAAKAGRPAAKPAIPGAAKAPAAPPPSAARPQSLDDFLKLHEKTFSEYLLDLLRERGGKDSEVYKRAEVSKQLFSKILSDRNYQPTKSTAVQLAIGLQLDLPMTQKFLERAGYSLTRSSKADLVVQYYIERKIYNVVFINEALFDCGLPPLKTGLKS